LEVRVEKKRFTEEQIAYALAQESTGQTIAEICRKLGVSEQTFYRWKKKFGSMGVAEVRRLKQLEDENAKLKRLVADLSLDRAILQDVLRKKSDSRPAPRAGRVRAGCLPGDGASGMPRAVRFARDDSLRVSEAWAGGSSDADQGDRRGAPELGLAADPCAAPPRWLAGQPQVDGAPVSPGRHESESKSRRRRKSVVTRGPHVAPTRKDERWRPRHADRSPRAT
jgi:putative transposase